MPELAQVSDPSGLRALAHLAQIAFRQCSCRDSMTATEVGEFGRVAGQVRAPPPRLAEHGFAEGPGGGTTTPSRKITLSVGTVWGTPPQRLEQLPLLLRWVSYRSTLPMLFPTARRRLRTLMIATSVTTCLQRLTTSSDPKPTACPCG